MGEETQNDMVASPSIPVTWQDIELSESYLVCGMFEEASTLASSILTRINGSKKFDDGDEILFYDIMTSAAMVLVQSWKESGRTSNLLDELENYFGSVTDIPCQVILTGACVQVSGGNSSGVRTFLENFLSEWKFDDDKYHAISLPTTPKLNVGACNGHSKLEVNNYLEIVEFYAFTLLGSVLKDVDHALIWVEKAQLPEEARQDLLRRLFSLSHLKSTSDPLPECHALSVKEVKQSDKPIILSTRYHNGEDGTKLSAMRWLQNIFKKSSNASSRKLMLGCLIFLVSYLIQRKRDTIMRVVKTRAVSLKHGLVDLWQLAFSYQVNPLAAVQPLPSRSRQINFAKVAETIAFDSSLQTACIFPSIGLF